jgi:WD40 repeat protein/tetratricopeptide (TPR) repeat protein/tRNA A-37 threonylcarbamoyl transferase component Bud32
MHLVCPHCQSPVQVAEENLSDVVLCSACGSSFGIGNQVQTTIAAPRGAGSLGKFDLLEGVGSGAFGTVYRARDRELDRTVAIKVPRSGNFSNQDEQERFLREARSVAQLRHPSIVSVYEVGQSDGTPYLVSEFVDGTTLADYLTGARPSTRESTELVAKVADALQYAHSQGVVHRDVKPSNIMLDADGMPHVLDFGLARRDAGDATMTTDGQVLGTPAYMSPEQAKGESHSVDGRGDVYSLGVIFYQLLTGELPFRGNTRMLLHQLLHDEPRPPRRINDLVPRDLETVCLKAMAKDRSRRYATAGEFADDLRRYLRGEPIAARPVGKVERCWRWCRRKPLVAGLAATVAVLLAGSSVGGLLVAHRESQLAADKGKLAEKNANLAESERNAKEKAQHIADENLKLAEQAEAARRESQTMLADMQTERGMMSAAQEEPAKAMLWFASAASVTPHDPSREAANRRRARNWMSDSFLPVAALSSHSTGDCREFAFQPNGDLLLSLQGGSLYIWDWRAEQSLSWTAELTAVRSGIWAPDGRRLAIGVADEVQIRDVPSGAIVHRLNMPSQIGPIAAMAYTRDGKRLAIAGKTVQLWNLSAEAALERQWPHPQPVHALLFNRAGTRLVTACSDKQVRVFDIFGDRRNFEPLFPPLPHAPQFDLPPVLFDNDQRLITITRPAGPLGWWDTNTGQNAQPATADLRISYVRRLAASPDGRWFAAGADRIVVIWNVNGERFKAPHANLVKALAFRPDNSGLVSGCDDWMARLWSIPRSDRRPVAIPQMEMITNCAFSDDGAFLAVRGADETRVWKCPAPGAVVGQIGWKQRVWRARPGFDGQWVTCSAWHEGPIDRGRFSSLAVVEARTGRPAGPAIPVNDIFDSVLCADNRSVAVGALDGQTGKLSVFDVSTGRELFSPIKLPRLPISVAARPGHPDVGVMCLSGDIVVVDQRGGARLLDIIDEPSSNVLRTWCRVAYSPDGSKLIALTSRNEVVVRDATTGKLLYPPIQPVLLDGPCRTLAVSDDSRWLATGVNGRNAVQVWDLTTGQAAGAPLLEPGDFYGIFAVTFSPDGRWVLSGNKDGRARVWDWRTGALVCPPLQHADEVLDVAFTPDGRHALTAVRNGTVHIWELATGKLIAPPLRYPLPPFTSTETISVVGEHVIAGAIGYPVCRLTEFLADPTESATDLQALAELISGERLALGELSGMGRNEWNDRWRRFRETPETAAIVAAWARPDPRAAHELAAKEAETSGRLPDAIESLSRLIGLQVDDPSLYLRRAAVYVRLGKFPEADDDFAKAEKSGATIDVWLARGRTLHNRREYERAIGEFTRVIDQKPGQIDLTNAHFFRGMAYAEIEEWEQARRDETATVALVPQSFMGWKLRALSELGLGDTGAYRETCRAALERLSGSDNAYALESLVSMCVRAPDAGVDPAAIVKFAEQAVEKFPKNANFQRTLGHAFYRAGMYEKSIDRLREVVSMGGGSLPIDWLIVAMAHHRLGHADEARRWLDKVEQWLVQYPQVLSKPEPGKSVWHVDLRMQFKMLHREARELLNGTNEESQ